MLAAIALLAGPIAFSEGLPSFSASGPDAAAYGEAQHYPVGSPTTFFEKKYMVGSFSHFDLLFPARSIEPAGTVWKFERPAMSPEITYFHAGSRYSLQDYLSHLPVTGLLIAKDDQIFFEGYQYGRTDRDRLTSQSMAKTVVGMLIGVALSEKALGSVTDTAQKYVPELKNAVYGKITIRDLLHMSSGISCDSSGPALENITLETLMHKCKQDVPEGTRFEYSAADSELLGLILSRAVHMPLAAYLEQKVWRNIGTEAKASWTIDASDHEVPYCCFNAVLRDYARLARLLAFDGGWNGKQLIPQQWLLDATTVNDSDQQLVPGKSTRFFGYGYQVWIFPGARRMFALLGANGQRIFVDPQSKLIMAQTAVTEKAIDPKVDAEMIALWMALIRHYGS